jgi:glycosyltransferase involved in cell wall biosynthesis
MRILLLGEYSNVHNTLAEGLRTLGHEVTVASNGDFWKNYPRDINLTRTPGKIGGLALLARVYSLLPKWRNYDVVQLINPMFLELKAERLFHIYNYLRRHNKKIILCAMGMDWYWVDACVNRKVLRYSDFNIGDRLRTDMSALIEKADWTGTTKERLNKLIAQDCDAIVTGLYEYHVSYSPYFPAKTHYIPLPIKLEKDLTGHEFEKPEKLKVFIGISKGRSAYKGTDIMLKAAEDLLGKYADRMELRKTEGLPFEQYCQIMNGSDAILDQLYSYTPSMNSLLAMGKGIVCIGGGEPEHYELLGEQSLRPIVNVQPCYESVYHELQQLILHPERIARLKRESVEYVKRHYDYISVARQYEKLYLSEKQ